MDAAHFFRDQWRPFSRLFQLSLFVNTLTLKFLEINDDLLVVSFNYHYSWTPWHLSFLEINDDLSVVSFNCHYSWPPWHSSFLEINDDLLVVSFNFHYSWPPWHSSFLEINDDLSVVSFNCHYSLTPWHSSFFRDQWRPFSRLFQLSLFVNTLTFKFASMLAARCNTCLTSIVF